MILNRTPAVLRKSRLFSKIKPCILRLCSGGHWPPANVVLFLCFISLYLDICFIYSICLESFYFTFLHLFYKATVQSPCGRPMTAPTFGPQQHCEFTYTPSIYVLS